MGQLVDGIWKDIWYDTKSTGGHFKRSTSQFRNWVTADGQAGPQGKAGFKPKQTATICMFLSPARGRIELYFYVL